MGIKYEHHYNSGLVKNLLSKHLDSGFIGTFLTEAKLLGVSFDLNEIVEKCKDMTDATLEFVLAMDDKKLAGVLAIHNQDRREIQMLWVEEAYRKRKVGRKLVERFQHHVNPLPLKVECLKGNTDGLAFYEKLGFEFVDKARFPSNVVGYTKVKL